MIHRVQASINLKALQANFKLAKLHAGLNNQHPKMLAVIKANAYGHGLIEVAEALDPETDAFAVTDLTEALLLKNSANINKPVVILQGLIDRQDIKLIAEANFQLVVHSLEQLALLEEELSTIKLTKPLTFWLKINSGMGRLGIAPEHYAKAFLDLQNKAYCQEVIMMTHLANSSLPDSALNQQQLLTFNNIQGELNSTQTVTTSIPASSGLLADLKTQSNWARPGLMLYGSSPFPFQDQSMRRESFNLQAVMTLQSKLIAIQHLNAGDNVGYCSQYICPKPMLIGIVCIGYADGYPSTTPNGAPVLVNGKRTFTTGRVSMDMLAIDLSEIPNPKVGDLVTLWGEDLSLDEIAESSGILSYNLTCSISPRVKRVYG